MISEDDLIGIVGIGCSLVLVGAGLASRRRPLRRWAPLAIGWVAIILATWLVIVIVQARPR